MAVVEGGPAVAEEMEGVRADEEEVEGEEEVSSSLTRRPRAGWPRVVSRTWQVMRSLVSSGAMVGVGLDVLSVGGEVS